MKTLNRLVAAGFILFALPAVGDEIPESLRAIIPTVQSWGANPVLVTAVREQNAAGQTLDQIKEKDKAWMATEGVDPFMKSLMENPAAVELAKLEASAPYFLELFLMDAQGANVAMTNKTSDYWQGDEPKFTEAHKGGVGAVHVGKVSFDSSAQSYLTQISVPVMDEGQAIGALTVGIDLDELEKK